MVKTRRGESAERGGATVSPGRPVLTHRVAIVPGEEEPGIMRVRLEGRGETLPVFSAGWAARGYMFAGSQSRGWHTKACTPDDVISLLIGPCADVEWVAFDPKPGFHSKVEAVSMMPKESFLGHLSYLRNPLPA